MSKREIIKELNGRMKTRVGKKQIPNKYGNFEKVPEGWVRCEKTAANKVVKYAMEKGFAGKILVGWGGTKNYPKPILSLYIDSGIDYTTKLNLVDKTIGKKLKIAREENEKQRKRERERYLLEREKFNNDVENLPEEIKKVMKEDFTNRWDDTDFGGDYAYEAKKYLLYYLRDIKEANPEWLRDAIGALNYQIRNQSGIMWKWVCDEDVGDFHACLGYAIGAYRRHTYTNYDARMMVECHGDYETRMQIRQEIREDIKIQQYNKEVVLGVKTT